MNMEMERWKTDGRMQKVLVAILKIAGTQRSVLTTYREMSRNADWLRVDHITAALKNLRREGVIAIKTTVGRGTQVTLLRKLQIGQREEAPIRR